MYATTADPYCYPGTSVLKNKLGLRDQAGLSRAETVLSAQRLAEGLPGGRFSAHHYRRIHHHIFQDVYQWAGRYRTVRMAKGSSMFCYPEHIEREMFELFRQLSGGDLFAGRDRSSFVAVAARFLADLNAIHPFRDGNGRSQLALMAALADHAGFPLRLQALKPRRFLKAMVLSFHGELVPLQHELTRMVIPSRRKTVERG